MAISADFLNRVANKQWANAAAIDAFFGMPFIKWFNTNVANRGNWAGKSIADTPESAARFKTFWDDPAVVFGPGGPNPVQFICLMSIFVNEVSGNLLPLEERVGTTGHPGIAYAFDRIAGLKKSYNTLPGNETANDLFRDPAYRGAHGHRALAERFPTPAAVDPAWAGEQWPAGFPTRTDPTVTGFLLEADFYKFRGRGLIQTTGRTNYVKLVEFVQNYAGIDPILKEYATRWAGKAPDAVATTSSNGDWRRLFFSGTLELARVAIVLHNVASGDYLKLAVTNAATLNSTAASTPGSVFFMGRRISGTDDYATKFRARVDQICALL